MHAPAKQEHGLVKTDGATSSSLRFLTVTYPVPRPYLPGPSSIGLRHQTVALEYTPRTRLPSKKLSLSKMTALLAYS